MKSLLDGIVVGLVLLGAVGYASVALGPRALRRKVLQAMAWVMAFIPGIAQRLRTAASKAGSSCGGCGDCSSSAPTPEVRIPVRGIKRR